MLVHDLGAGGVERITGRLKEGKLAIEQLKKIALLPLLIGFLRIPMSEKSTFTFLLSIFLFGLLFPVSKFRIVTLFASCFADFPVPVGYALSFLAAWQVAKYEP